MAGTDPLPVGEIINDGEGFANDDEVASVFGGLLSDEEPPKEAPQEAAPEADDAETDEAPEERAADEGPEPEGEEQPAGDDEAEDEAEAEEAPADEQPQTFRVRLADGTETDVGVDELKNGYLRNADYTRKTQSLSEERKALQSEAETAKREREQLQQTLKAVRVYAEQSVRGGWTDEALQRLRNEDPQQYLLVREEINERNQKLRVIQAQEQMLGQRSQQETEERYREDLKKAKERLLGVIPEWKDPSVATREKAEIADLMRDEGYSEDELVLLTDHRAVKLLRELSSYRRAKAKIAKKPKPDPAPKMQPAQATPTPGKRASKQQQAQKDFDRLKKRGDIDSAAQVLRHIL